MGLLYSPASGTTAGASREIPRTPSTLDDDRPQIRLTQIENPTWKPVDLHIFAAPIGPPPDFPLFLETALALLNPARTRHHMYHSPQLFVGPGDPHGPPYNREFRDGFARLDLDELGPFTVADFSDPNAVWLAWMTVPKPGIKGSSPDFRKGPIISNELFPFTSTAATTRNGAPFSGSDPILIPPLDDALTPPFTVDGHSHFPDFYADNIGFGPPNTDPVGSYTYQLTVSDNGGAGWLFEADFVVVSGTDDDDDGGDG